MDVDKMFGNYYFKSRCFIRIQKFSPLPNFVRAHNAWALTHFSRHKGVKNKKPKKREKSAHNDRSYRSSIEFLDHNINKLTQLIEM